MWVYLETPYCNTVPTKSTQIIYKQLVLATHMSTMLDSFDSDICICNVAGNTKCGEMIDCNMVDQIF